MIRTSSFVRKALLVAAVAAVGVAGCSDDDDDGGSLAGGGQADGQVSPDAPGGEDGDGGLDGSDDGGSAGEDGGYSDADRDTFVAVCSTYDGATVPLCECAFDDIERSVPPDEYREFEEAVVSQGAPPVEDLPGFVVTAVASCQ